MGGREVAQAVLAQEVVEVVRGALVVDLSHRRRRAREFPMSTFPNSTMQKWMFVSTSYLADQ